MSANPLSSRARAFVLAEALIAVLAGILFLLSAAVIFLTSTVSFAKMGSYITLDSADRNALDQMTRQIREARSLATYSSSVLTFNYDDASTPLTNLTYRYDSTKQMLTEEWNTTAIATNIGAYSATNILLTSCTNLVFSLYDRSYAQLSDTNGAKVIGIAWRCVATNLMQTTSEDMQQAKIVIRNQP
jgi:Tfp pilus assembly protein PilW